MFTDTHAHLNDSRLYEKLDSVLAAAEGANVKKIICVGYNLPSSLLATSIAKEHADVFAAIGIHPHDSKYYSKDAERALLEIAKDKKVVAFGEIGLDYHYDLSDRKIQREVFERQLKVANELKLPVVIHTREAMDDTLSILNKNKNLLGRGGVIHCYSEKVDYLQEIFNLGLVISVGGMITFKKPNLSETVRFAGRDNIILETDCPYLTPAPHRSEMNEPKFIELIAKRLAEILGCSLQDVEKSTENNVKRVFCI